MGEVIWGAIVGNTAVVGILAFLFKSIVDNRLKMDFQKYQNDLENKTNLILAQFQSELEKERIRLQVSYGGIFEKQAEAVIQVYNSLIEMDRSIYGAIHSGQGTEDRKENYKKFFYCWQKLSRDVEEMSILLPKEIVEIIEKLLQDTVFGVRGIRNIDYRLSRSGLSEKQYDKYFEQYDENMKIIDDFPQIKKEVIASFRKIIGINNEL